MSINTKSTQRQPHRIRGFLMRRCRDFLRWSGDGSIALAFTLTLRRSRRRAIVTTRHEVLVKRRRVEVIQGSIRKRG